MAAVRIRDLDDEAYATPRRRAAATGRSLQEYPRVEVEGLARRPTLDEVVEGIRSRAVSDLPMDDIVALQREDRER
ncbi:hypothetical protein [Streptomyces sp. NPDC007088]|uniref:FitA-like ribbon-helix-helix domain-containing protein n=1 Tax=Streptomyces sp. NPDC007088 TaxID=3364773 RepID=UPI0036AD5CDC